MDKAIAASTGGVGTRAMSNIATASVTLCATVNAVMVFRSVPRPAINVVQRDVEDRIHDVVLRGEQRPMAASIHWYRNPAIEAPSTTSS
ncbi:MAG TPA: hypothetical protein VNU48_02935 [Burkholderiaceae bacterium]|nr:hypothetical protein [Burkholderiaceae bacterium]